MRNRVVARVERDSCSLLFSNTQLRADAVEQIASGIERGNMSYTISSNDSDERYLGWCKRLVMISDCK